MMVLAGFILDLEYVLAVFDKIPRVGPIAGELAGL